MAVTKIWKGKGSLSGALSYIKNPKKTEGQRYVSGINCTPDIAEEEMALTKSQYGKTGGVTFYHAYQSFKPGEVTAKEAHGIGVKLAEKMWGGRFQVVTATHLDRGNIHNHFIVSSVSFADGKKYRHNKALYHQFRQLSDGLCQARGLSVPKNPRYQDRSPARWEAEQGGTPVWRDVIREDIDIAIANSAGMEDFYRQLKTMGYSIKQGRHLALSPPGKEGYIRVKSLNHTDYLPDGIRRRIAENHRKTYGLKPKKAVPKVYKKRARPKRKLSGYRALYVRYLYQLGKIPVRKGRSRAPTFVKKQRAHLNAISRQVKLLVRYSVNETSDLDQLEAILKLEISALEREREIRRKEVRRTQPEAQREVTRQRITHLTERLRAARIDLKTCSAIRQTSEKLQTAARTTGSRTAKAAGKEEHKHERRSRSRGTTR